MNRLDILNLEWPKSDRDRHIITPVYVYLKEKYRVSVHSDNVLNGYFYLLKYRPKLLLLSNSVGTDIHFLLTKIAYQMGIKTVALISEGNIPNEEQIDEFFWGWNTDKTLYEDARILWSECSKNLVIKKYPQLADKLYVSGATGFDKYTMMTFAEKNAFIRRHAKTLYNKVIGIAGWGFDLYSEDNQDWEHYKLLWSHVLGEKQIQMHRKDLFLMRDIYAQIIHNNPDTLFILRPHPAIPNIEKTEFAGLEHYSNTYISNPRINHPGVAISDLINVADIWIAYSSTTALEAWLLRKPTILVNPTTSRFLRDSTYLGSPIVSSYRSIQKLMTEFYSSGTIRSFESLRIKRKQIIKDVIECDDGKNHIRAAEIIYTILKQRTDRTRRITYWHFPFVRMARQCIGFYRSNNSNIALDVELYESLYTQPIHAEIQHETNQT